MILITAKFIGKSSLGFIQGKSYSLEVNVYGIWFDAAEKVTETGSVKIFTNAGTFPDFKRINCEYGSLDTFLKFWRVIKISLIDEDSDLHVPKTKNIFLRNKLTESMRDLKLETLLK